MNQNLKVLQRSSNGSTLSSRQVFPGLYLRALSTKTHRRASGSPQELRALVSEGGRGRAGEFCSADLGFATKDSLLKIQILGLLKCCFVVNNIALSILSDKALVSLSCIFLQEILLKFAINSLSGI